MSFASLGLLQACSSHGGGTSSNVALQMPQVLHRQNLSGQATTLVANHVVVQISASDINPPIAQITEASHVNGNDCDPNNPAPTSVTLTVPQGTGRLIQVLTAYCDSSNPSGGFTIYYGNQSTDLAQPSVSVSITASQIGTTTGTQGGFTGRFLDAAGNGRTGKVNMMIHPPGQPPMIISRAEMFGGWFNFFGLQSQAFDYAFEDGTPIFSNTSLSTAFPVPQTAVINIPSAYKNQGGTGSTYQQQPPFQYVVGFFGSAPKNRRLCSFSQSQSLSGESLSSAGSPALSWTGTTPSSGAYVTGGDSTQTCSGTGTAFQDFIQINPNNVTSRDSVLGFRGPFLLQSSGGAIAGQFIATAANPTMTLTWSYLPGAITGLDGFEIFHIWNAAGTAIGDWNAKYRVNDGIDCSSLVADGFTDDGKASAPSSTGIVTQTLTFKDFQANATPTIIVCPFRVTASGIQYFHGAGEWGNGGGQQQYRLVVQGTNGPFDNGIAYTGACKHMQALTQTMSGAAAPVSSSLTIPLSFSGPNSSSFVFHSTSSCNSDVITSTTISSGNSADFWVSTTASANSFTSITANSSGYYSANLPLFVYQTPGSAGKVNVAWGNNGLSTQAMATGQCYQITYQFNDIGGTNFTTTTTAASYTPTASIGGSWYSDPGCTQSLPSNQVQVPAGSSMTWAYFSPSATSGSGSFAAPTNVSGVSPGATPIPIPVAPATLASYSLVVQSGDNNFGSALVMSGTLAPNTLSVQQLNSVGAVLNSPAPASVTISAVSGAGFCANQNTSAANCTGASVNYTLPSNNQIAGYFNLTADQALFTVTDTTNSITNSNISIVIGLPHLVWTTTGNISSAAYPSCTALIVSLQNAVGGAWYPPTGMSLTFSGVSNDTYYSGAVGTPSIACSGSVMASVGMAATYAISTSSLSYQVNKGATGSYSGWSVNLVGPNTNQSIPSSTYVTPPN